jgi:hypothetical protein
MYSFLSAPTVADAEHTVPGDAAHHRRERKSKVEEAISSFTFGADNRTKRTTELTRQRITVEILLFTFYVPKPRRSTR